MQMGHYEHYTDGLCSKHMYTISKNYEHNYKWIWISDTLGYINTSAMDVESA